MKKSIVLVFLGLTGCAYLVPIKTTQAEIDTLGYGEPLTIDYQKVIKDYFQATLFDPFSAKYEFREPTKSAMRDSINDMNGQRLHAGYLVAVYVNAKNRYGAYVGSKKYQFLFRDNKIEKIKEGIQAYDPTH